MQAAQQELDIIMIGASGAVGGECLKHLTLLPSLKKLTLINRKNIDLITDKRIEQHSADLSTSSSYSHLINSQTSAICTVGVGEPSKVSKEVFNHIDFEIPLNFAKACKDSGVKHFSILVSIGANPSSKSFYLRKKGELEEELKSLNFDRLSLFHPSMILTPSNRYGISQGLTLMFWPKIHGLLQGPMRSLRGVKVELLGKSIAFNLNKRSIGCEILRWDDFQCFEGE